MVKALPVITSRSTRVPPIMISRHALCAIWCSVGGRPAESGGILLGPIGTDRITDFYFDASAQCTRGSYSPDHPTLRRKMQEQWMPAGLDMRGFCHSHPAHIDELSGGDLEYIGRLLARNTDMSFFAAPIILPGHFRFCPIVVLRGQPKVQLATTLSIF